MFGRCFGQHFGKHFGTGFGEGFGTGFGKLFGSGFGEASKPFFLKVGTSFFKLWAKFCRPKKCPHFGHFFGPRFGPQG